MPAVSKAQQQVMAIAEHEPGKLYKRNRGLLKMDKYELHKYSSTSIKGLPKKSNWVSRLKKKVKKYLGK
jgi:hypothetical protein